MAHHMKKKGAMIFWNLRTTSPFPFAFFPMEDQERKGDSQFLHVMGKGHLTKPLTSLTPLPRARVAIFTETLRQTPVILLHQPALTGSGNTSNRQTQGPRGSRRDRASMKVVLNGFPKSPIVIGDMAVPPNRRRKCLQKYFRKAMI